MKRMPLPAAAAFHAFLALASAPGTRKRVARAVRGTRVWWSGKKIAVIGPTASGKDSFLARLQNREIPLVHSSSSMGEKVKPFSVKLALSHRQAIDVTCKGVINVGGEPEYRDAPSGWLSVCEDADVVFYVMTVEDLSERRFLKGRRIRDDLDWLLTAMPHLKRDALVHILVNKIDEEIESHTDYQSLAEELAKELVELEETVNEVLHPYEARNTGATLISMKNKQIYTRAIDEAFRAVHSAFHEARKRGGKAA
jgi:GTPase Era involved in 16S rRNA processing